MVKLTRCSLSDVGWDAKPRPHSNPTATLAPLIPLSSIEDSSIFHRALHLYNAEHLSEKIWDELTVPEQDEVRVLMRELQRRKHACSRKVAS
jgi:hypothetical protein